MTGSGPGPGGPLPLTGEAMKELVCDEGVAAIMKERMPAETYKKLEQAIKGRCPAVKKLGQSVCSGESLLHHASEKLGNPI